MSNRKKPKDAAPKTSKYLGVTWSWSNNRWWARIQANGKSISLGRFRDEDDAGRAYNKAAIQLYGKRARLNLIREKNDPLESLPQDKTSDLSIRVVVPKSRQTDTSPQPTPGQDTRPVHTLTKMLSSPERMTMNRKETAAALGVSIRTIDRYVAQGKLKRTLVENYFNIESEFDEAAVLALKEQQEAMRTSMNTKDAAAALGVTSKTIQRYVTQGKLKATQTHGQFGPENYFDEAEVLALKEQRQTPIHVARPSPKQDELQPAHPDQQTFALAEAIALALSKNQPAALPPAQVASPSVPIEAKPLLTLKECSALTGLSRDILRAAIESGKLKAKIIGKGFRVKRKDLNGYIERL